jgi:trk system potassium uptake protein TrkA
MAKGRSFVVIGLGTFGATVASELARFGNTVIGIDIVESHVHPLADTLSHAVIADARDEQALRDAGVEACQTAVIGIGTNLEANILAVMNVRLLGIETIWAKAMSKTHHRILTKMDVDRVIQPEAETGQHIAQMLNNPLLRDYVSIGNGYHVVTIIAPDYLGGKRISTLRLEERFELRCLGVMRGTEFLGYAAEDPELRAGDNLLLLGRRPALRNFSDSL